MATDIVWKLRPWHLAIGLFVSTLMLLVFFDGLQYMEAKWGAEEYNHAYMLPFVAAFLVWQRSGAIRQIPFQSSWVGVLVAALGLFAYVAGDLGTLYTVIQYGFLITLGGFLLSLMGWRAFRIILPAYALLFFMVPLPVFLYNNLSGQLQLISSEFGVAFIRLCAIPVYLGGNVIDLGNYKLQVAEACSGLRYLFPLTALGFIAAVVYKGALWKKAVLLLSTIPITVSMNSFRIGVIGVLVDQYGIEMAEGFLHDFEGWVVFMACAAILVLEMWLLSHVGKDQRPFREAFSIEWPDPPPDAAAVERRRVPVTFYASAALLVAVAIVSQVLPDREEIAPDRRDFVLFPREIDGWRGEIGRLEPVYLDALKLDDYLLGDFTNVIGDTVNLYVAYYDSQRKGASAHSPKSCLPGGGWEIQELSQRSVEGAFVGEQPLRVNRALIQLGDERQLVYYWFQQRGRVMTNEYLVKWYLFWDALIRNRTDGALVRLATSVPLGSDPAKADAALTSFAQSVVGQLQRYIPK